MHNVFNNFFYLLILLISIISCTNNSYEKENNEHFSFQGNTLFGEEYKSSEFLGKPMIINFWFPSCPPCTVELESLEKSYQEYKDSIEFLGIMQLGLDNENDGKKFLSKKNISFKSISDYDNLTTKFDVKYFPTTIFLDSNHNVVDTWIGIIDENDITLKLSDLELIK